MLRRTASSNLNLEVIKDLALKRATAKTYFAIGLLVLSDLGKATDKQVVRESLETTLKDVNPKLKSYERVQKLVILREPWTIENNKMTPTLKIKRNIIEKEFAPKVDAWYNKSEAVFWE